MALLRSTSALPNFDRETLAMAAAVLAHPAFPAPIDHQNITSAAADPGSACEDVAIDGSAGVATEADAVDAILAGITLAAAVQHVQSDAPMIMLEVMRIQQVCSMTRS